MDEKKLAEKMCNRIAPREEDLSIHFKSEENNKEVWVAPGRSEMHHRKKKI